MRISRTFPPSGNHEPNAVDWDLIVAYYREGVLNHVEMWHPITGETTTINHSGAFGRFH